MTRYVREQYPNRPPKPGETYSVTVNAIGDKPVAGFVSSERYPHAYLGAVVTPGSTSPNFNLVDERKPTLDEHEEKVSKEIGIDNPRDLSPTLQNTFWRTSNKAKQLKSSREYPGMGSFYPRQLGIEYAKGISKLKKGTSELFTTTPETAYVSSAFSHSSMRQHIPILGAYLHQQHGNIDVSGDLSKHSSGLVEHLQEKGYPIKLESGEKPRATNGISFNDNGHTLSRLQIEDLEKAGQVISPGEIASAKQHFRTIRKGQKLSQQFDALLEQSQGEQLKFPGMEE